MGGLAEATGSRRQKMMQREVHGVETTQIDRWGQNEPWGEAQPTVTHGRGVGR